MEETLKVRVLRMAPEGEAVAKAEDSARVIFISGGAPGDLCEARVFSAKSHFARARLSRVLTAGPDRVDPPCPLHLAPGRPEPTCGGCDWQHLRYEAQLAHKTAVVRDCVERIAKLKAVPIRETLASPRPWAYRNKVLVPFGEAGGRLTAGFYAAGSHRIVDFRACPVQPELSVRIVLKAKELAASLRWQPWDERAGRGWLRHLLVRTNSREQAIAAVVTRGPQLPRGEEFTTALRAAFPQIVGLYQNVQPMRTSVILGPRWNKLWGAERLEERLGRFSFLVSPGAFLQVNREAAEILYEAARSALTEDGRSFDAVLDLYCGVGTLSLWLAQSARRVVGIEENREAVRDAWKSAQRNGVRNASFSAGTVESVLPRLLKRGLGSALAAVVDPPRAGLTVPVLRGLTARPFERVVYVSCNPATFARDAGYLSTAGFSLRRVQPVDLFPQTSHVELVGLFDRIGPRA
ncbi:MAG: 23S rRNA (uracil(1939)-C(5))-methyltransferase RlmD [Elusimicrobia bacterium]|nr:23S rRNA (uracil(1939)-C(5))-methyltransferase RlmD [Elusimicrobiota bacterium]